MGSPNLVSTMPLANCAARVKSGVRVVSRRSRAIVEPKVVASSSVIAMTSCSYVPMSLYE